MSEIPDKVHILKAAQLKNMGLLSHAQLCNAYRELAAFYYASESELATVREKAQRLEQERDAARKTSRELNRRNGVLQKVANDHMERGAWKRYFEAVWTCYKHDICRMQKDEAELAAARETVKQLTEALRSRHLNDLIVDCKYRRRTQARWMAEIRDAALAQPAAKEESQ